MPGETHCEGSYEKCEECGTEPCVCEELKERLSNFKNRIDMVESTRLNDLLALPDHVLEQPLTTEDGFINEACMNELASVLRNIPRTYERLKNEDEWSTQHCTNIREITGYFAPKTSPGLGP